MPAVLTDRRFSDPDWIYERKLTGDGKPHHPRYLGLRDDNPAREVVLERPQA